MTSNQPPGTPNNTGQNFDQPVRLQLRSCILASNPCKNNRHSKKLGTLTAYRLVRKTTRAQPVRSIFISTLSTFHGSSLSRSVLTRYTYGCVRVFFARRQIAVQPRHEMNVQPPSVRRIECLESLWLPLH